MSEASLPLYAFSRHAKCTKSECDNRLDFGDPAGDVTSLTLNYVFFSMQRSGRLEGAFETLFLRFWGVTS